MQNIQLYIEGQRVEMFKDESVTITDSIKNVNDVSKVFTEFSKTFSLPASKETNKIFKHFYNSDIENGYDARIRVKAKIELNNLPFKDGYIKLEGVDLKDNKAHTYRITFFGNTVSLKNVIGDDVLTDLTWLGNFNENTFGNPIIYNASTIFDYIRNQRDKTVDGVLYEEPLQVPLLTHTQRLTYDSGTNLANSGNLYWNNTSSVNRGVRWDELKFSIKLLVIIKAIEEQYGITFSEDFFNFDNDEIKDLYMWLHRTKGEVTSGGQVETFLKQATFTNLVTDESSANYAFSSTIVNGNFKLSIPSDWSENVGFAIYRYEWSQFEPLRFYVRPATGYGSVNYDVVVYKDGNVHWSGTNRQGNIEGVEMPANLGTYTVVVRSEEAIIFDRIIFENRIRWNRFQGSNANPTTYYSLETINSYNTAITTDFEFNILQQLPKMKVLDFLTSIFKKYNLVTYLEDEIIVVKKLEDFYSNGKTYDVTKYIDVNKSQVNSALPFREVEYSYKGLKTFLAATHEQLFGKPWGTEEFVNKDTTKYSGGIFKQQADFEHLKFERLVDINTSEQTPIQWGWCVDDNQESFIGSPILFHLRQKDYFLDPSISFVNSIAANGSFNGRQELSKWYQPQNTNIQSNTGNYKSLNFKQEIDEFTGEIANNSLFNTSHISYMTSIFNESNRITKLTAYLPLGILLNYKLNDKFLISEKSYKINSIKTNLQNGKSELELLNDYTQLLTANHYISSDIYGSGHPDNNPRIFIEWTEFYGSDSYNVSINGTVSNTVNTYKNPIELSFYQDQGISTLVIFVEALDDSANVLQTSNTMTVQI